ncbi:unnamed protein product [Spirodela intermedia]|uniref:Uncharacterized protein n=2 Tax=Spirodela intermedia TaxID=51605 RepID=A0A7I8KNR9_SPIIN|nr:unnamed protein product [Spirodela intermedia]CAA6663030.1 unnamed protein product [Spirodela intermedia]CAA7399457.1 unnamed protein product [Spirodela intermedia]
MKIQEINPWSKKLKEKNYIYLYITN